MPRPLFDGETYDEERDRDRLEGQLIRVREIMQDGKWRTLRRLAGLADAPEASVSARLRDLRKPRFGSYEVERKYVENGVWKYRVLPPRDEEE